MAISGQQVIAVGLQNESANSDSLYTAFNKTVTNFATLFACASPYNTFTGNTSNIGYWTSISSAQITNPQPINSGSDVTGGGGDHTHPFSFSSGSGTFSGNAINLAVKYYDFIIASKD
jgi:hypothetical protein